MDYRDYLAQKGGAQACGVYEKSVQTVGDSTVFLAAQENCDVLVISGSAQSDFVGTVEMVGQTRVTVAPLNHANACALRKLVPFTAPVPVLSHQVTVGVGDRLGIATPGHLRVFEAYDALPILAQQSIRELDLTGRTYEDVLDCVSFAVLRDGFTRGFGADGDHLKRAQDVQYALDLGFTMITLDCSEHIQNGVDTMSDCEVNTGVSLCDALAERYLGKVFDVGEGVKISYDETALKRIVLIYGEAIDFAVSIYEQFLKDGKYAADFEISIDETATPTTPAQHFFVANELIRRGVKFATMAPRFCGEFQKGVDYIGDLKQFESEMIDHSAIARHFGYKLSIHSGSDKFMVFPIIGKYTQGRVHVKTAGTNWLEAMRVVAQCDPALYREVHAFALSVFDEATKYYHVTTDLNQIPALDTLTDAQLPELFGQNDARQLIHITYGLILSAVNQDGTARFKDRLYQLWKEHAQEYSDALYAHIGHHLKELGIAKR